MHETNNSSVTFCELFTCDSRQRREKKERKMPPWKEEKGFRKETFDLSLERKRWSLPDKRHFVEIKGQV